MKNTTANNAAYAYVTTVGSAEAACDFPKHKQPWFKMLFGVDDKQQILAQELLLLLKTTFSCLQYKVVYFVGAGSAPSGLVDQIHVKRPPSWKGYR